jgi:putative transposase
MRYRRERTAGGCYFFTVVTHNRQPVLTTPDTIERLRESLRREQQRRPFEIEAMVVLPEHLHCLWCLPEGDTDYSGRWNRVKRYFSIRCCGITAKGTPSRESKREHRIRDDDDWRKHMDYIHYNPVKHGYAVSPGAWQYSSFRRCVERGLYEPHWGTHGAVVIGDIEAGE